MITAALRGFLPAIAAALLLAACARVTPIKNIVEHPRDYAGQEVSVEGEVTGVFSLIFVKYFTLDDGSGSITVVTEKPLPRKGERLRVKGTVEEAFSLGDQTLTLIVEKKEGGAQPTRP